MNNTSIAYQHFTLEQWKWIVLGLNQLIAQKPSHEAKEQLVEILKRCPSAAQ